MFDELVSVKRSRADRGAGSADRHYDDQDPTPPRSRPAKSASRMSNLTFEFDMSLQRRMHDDEGKAGGNRHLPVSRHNGHGTSGFLPSL